MRRRTFITAATGVVTSLAGCAGQEVVSSEDVRQRKTRIDRLEQTVENRQTEIRSLEQTLSDRQDRVESLEITLENRTERLENLNTTVENIQGQLDAKNTTVSSLRTDVSQRNTEIANQEDEIASLEETITELQNDVSDLRQSRADLRSELSSVQTENGELERTVETVRDQVETNRKQRIVDFYNLGLSFESFAVDSFSRGRSYYSEDSDYIRAGSWFSDAYAHYNSAVASFGDSDILAQDANMGEVSDIAINANNYCAEFRDAAEDFTLAMINYADGDTDSADSRIEQGNTHLDNTEDYEIESVVEVKSILGIPNYTRTATDE